MLCDLDDGSYGEMFEYQDYIEQVKPEILMSHHCFSQRNPYCIMTDQGSLTKEDLVKRAMVYLDVAFDDEHTIDKAVAFAYYL